MPKGKTAKHASSSVPAGTMEESKVKDTKTAPVKGSKHTKKEKKTPKYMAEFADKTTASKPSAASTTDKKSTPAASTKGGKGKKK